MLTTIRFMTLYPQYSFALSWCWTVARCTWVRYLEGKFLVDNFRLEDCSELLRVNSILTYIHTYLTLYIHFILTRIIRVAALRLKYKRTGDKDWSVNSLLTLLRGLVWADQWLFFALSRDTLREKPNIRARIRSNTDRPTPRIQQCSDVFDSGWLEMHLEYSIWIRPVFPYSNWILVNDSKFSINHTGHV